MTIVTNKKQSYVWWLGLACVAVILGGYCATISFHGMPPSEGWYTWYAQLINSGKTVYKDFSYLFYPLYIQFISVFCKIFGYNIIALRILGLVLFMAIGIALYILFCKLTSVPSAALASIATAMFLQSEVVQLFYDYIRLFDLFAFIAIYFLVDYMIRLSKNEGRKIPVALMLSALFSTAACMIKQSTGTLLIVYTVVLMVFVALILGKGYTKKLFTDTAWYILVVLVLFGVMLVWIYLNGAAAGFFKNATGDALGAKGGLANVLFRWIVNLGPLMVTQILPAIGFLSFVLVIVVVSRVYIRKREDEGRSEVIIGKKEEGILYKVAAGIRENLVFLFAGALLTGALIIACRKIPEVSEYFFKHYDADMPIYGFILCTICFAIIGFSSIFAVIKFKNTPHKDKVYNIILQILPWFALLGSIFALGYGSGISGGLCESQTALTVGFIIIFLSKVLENSKARIFGMIILTVYTSSFAAACASRKYLDTYNWWHLSEGEIWEAKYVSDNPLLKGIKINSYEKLMYDGVTELIEERTDEDDTIFCFPHIPIFYSLTNRSSETYTQVQWFDVSNIKDIERDVETLKNSPPKAIIYCDVPLGVYDTHEENFNKGEKSQMRIMSDFLVSLIIENGYARERSYYICEGYTVHVYIRVD